MARYMRVWGPYSQDFGYDLINTLLVIYDSKSGAKSNSVIVFVVVCAPCMLAGEQTPQRGGTGGIAESKEECGRGWPMV